MPRCAFLTTKDLEDFFVYDELVKPHLHALGWQVDDVIWHDAGIDYSLYDTVVVRSTWDYQAYPEEFLACLSRIDASGAVLENAYSLMLWNFSKSYLKDLAYQGIATLPTLWFEAFDYEQICQSFKRLASDEIIIKPLVSANADFTYRLSFDDFIFQQQKIKQELGDKAIMLQAFESSILELGEYSLFYFDGVLSHAINKRPEKGDFRVQEEHGGVLNTITATNDMCKLAEACLKVLPHSSLYARIDILDTAKGLAIIEVELIEPSLYFNMDKASAERFAMALHKRAKSKLSPGLF